MVVVPKTPLRKKWPKNGGIYPWWGDGANFVRRAPNWARLCERPWGTKNRPRASSHPKMSARRSWCPKPPAEKWPKNGWDIALLGGWGELRPPGSEWGVTLRAASVCQKTSARRSWFPKPPCGKMAKKRVGYSLGGGMGRTSSAGLRMGRDFASVPKIGRGHVRAQKRAPEGRGSQNPPAEKWTKNGWDIALVGGCGQLRPPDSEWAETLRAASVCPRDVPSTAAPKNERPKAPIPQPPSEKCPKRGVGYSLRGGLGPTSSAGLRMGRDFASISKSKVKSKI